MRQVKRLAMLAAIHFRTGSPGFLGVAAGLLYNVGGIKPALEMASAEFTLGILFVAGTLPGLLDFHLVMRKLGGGGCGRGQSEDLRD